MMIGELIRVNLKDLVGDFCAEITGFYTDGKPKIRLVHAGLLGRDPVPSKGQYEVVA